MSATTEETCTRCGGHPREVCDECGQHACWEGEFMCENAKWAGTVIGPPRDIPEQHDWAVTRSAGSVRKHNGRTWEWYDEQWVLMPKWTQR